MIVALHGNLGAASDWDSCISGDDVWRSVDLWSEVKLGLNLEGWAKNFCERVDAEIGEQGRKPLLVGYSLGGRLALHAMAARPQLWSGAVIVSAHPGLAEADARVERLRVDAQWAEKARGLEWEAFLDQWNTQPVFAGGRAVVNEALIRDKQRALEIHREGIARAFELWSLGQQEAMGARLAACQCPLLWLNGSKDLKFVALGAGMADRVPKCEQRIIAGCGHRLIDEAADVVREAIRDFQMRNL